MALQTDAATLKDPYEVLGVERTASDAAVKSQYRKLALRFHPDKAPGPEASQRFQELTTAYGILSNPDKRRKYDAGGFQNLAAADLVADMELDLSSMGVVNTAVAAFFSKLGVPIKTAVPAMVLEAAYDGRFSATFLKLGEPHSDTVEKGGVHFYRLHLSQAQIDAGVVIGAHSAAGSRFKLILFEQSSGQWERLLQEDSAKVQRGIQMAGLFFLPFPTHHVGPRPGGLEVSEDPEAVLFRRLSRMQPREGANLKPGDLLVAVYGDNWFKRVSYTVQARLLEGNERGNEVSPDAELVRQVERLLLEKRDAVGGFEREYRQAQERFTAACAAFDKHQRDLDALLEKRDEAYLDLLRVPPPDAFPSWVAAHPASAGEGAISTEDGKSSTKTGFSFFSRRS